LEKKKICQEELKERELRDRKGSREGVVSEGETNLRNKEKKKQKKVVLRGITLSYKSTQH